MGRCSGALLALVVIALAAGPAAAHDPSRYGGVFRTEDGTWSPASAPEDAYPARAIVPAAGGDKVYLLGRSRLFASEDGGRRYRPLETDLPPGAEFGAIAVASGSPELLLAAIGGHLMRSHDGGRHWQGGAAGLPASALDTVTTDPYEPSRIWAAGADRVYRSEDLGRSWQAVGAALPEPHTMVRGIAADAAGTTIVLTTHRGMYRSEDAGATWIFKEDNLPIHIEAGPLTREPGDPRVLLTVYSYMPYPEVWRSAIEGGNLLARLDPLAIAGGISFLFLLFISGAWLALWLAHMRAARPEAGPATR